MSTKVSLIIPCFNRQEYLKIAIESVLDQSYENFDLLIADDGSTDNSISIAQGYTDPRVTFVSYPHRGVAHTMSDAIALTNGDYLGWVDSDDWLHPEALQKTVAILDTQTEIGCVYTDYKAIDELGNTITLSKSTRIPYSASRLLKDMMTHHFRLIRRDVYNAMGGIDTSFKFNYDYDLCLGLSRVTQFFHLNEVLYHRLMHKHSITGTYKLEQTEYADQALLKALAK